MSKVIVKEIEMFVIRKAGEVIEALPLVNGETNIWLELDEYDFASKNQLETVAEFFPVWKLKDGMLSVYEVEASKAEFNIGLGELKVQGKIETIEVVIK